MAHYFPIIEWFLYLGLVLAVIQRCTHCFTQLNIFTLFIGFFLLRHGITVPFDDDVNSWFAGIDVSAGALARFHRALYLMWGALAGAVVFARFVFGRSPIDQTRFRSEMKATSAGINPLFLVALLGSLVLIAIFQLRFDASFLRLITGQLSADEYRQMRDVYGETTNYSINAGYRIASIVRFGLLQLFVYTLFFLRKRSPFWRAAFWVTLSLGLLVGVISGQKTPALFIGIGLVIAWYYQSGRVIIRVWRWKLWAVIAVVLFAVIPFLYRLQYPAQDYGWRLRATFFRLSSEYDRSLQLYFEIYPNVEPFLHGKSSSLVDSVLGINMPESKLPERFIPLYYVSSDSPYYNTWNAAFVGVAWADFGFAGVIGESVFIGLLLYYYHAWFARARHTALAMGAQVALVLAATKLSEVALSASLLSFGLLTTTVGYICLKQFSPRRSAAVPAAHEDSPSFA